ncbi:unnamed protein product [Lampetra fluviatilis]
MTEEKIRGDVGLRIKAFALKRVACTPPSAFKAPLLCPTALTRAAKYGHLSPAVKSAARDPAGRIVDG